MQIGKPVNQLGDWLKDALVIGCSLPVDSVFTSHLAGRCVEEEAERCALAVAEGMSNRTTSMSSDLDGLNDNKAWFQIASDTPLAAGQHVLCIAPDRVSAEWRTKPHVSTATLHELLLNDDVRSPQGQMLAARGK